MSLTAEAQGFRRKTFLYIKALAMKCRLYLNYLKTCQLHWLHSDTHKGISESCAGRIWKEAPVIYKLRNYLEIYMERLRKTKNNLRITTVPFSLEPGTFRIRSRLHNHLNKLRGFSPQANYTNRASSACRQS